VTADVRIHGLCEPRFEAMREAFAANFEEGLDIGASLAVTLEGRLAVDLWGGHTDEARTERWEAGTLVPIASSGKMGIATAALMLVDRGQLDLDARVSDYWPEFAQGGKAHVLVRHALSHRSGVPGLDPPVTLDQLYDADAMASRIADEPHWFDGEPRLAYHSLTYVALVGELIRRADGRPFSRFWREEIADVIDVDMHFAPTEPAVLDRLRRHIWHPAPAPEPPPPLTLRIMSTIGWQERARPEYARLYAGNGRGIARLCAILGNRGEAFGRRFMAPATADLAGVGEAYEQCPVMGWLRMGLGFGLSSDAYPLPSPTAMTWGGLGGSMGYVDPAARISLGYTPNFWDPAFAASAERRRDPRTERFEQALRTSVLANLQT
jgi:CubicO group peptidase (beta-lactamase class C family)